MIMILLLLWSLQIIIIIYKYSIGDVTNMDFLDRKLWNMGVNQLVMGRFICFRCSSLLPETWEYNMTLKYQTILNSNAVYDWPQSVHCGWSKCFRRSFYALFHRHLFLLIHWSPEVMKGFLKVEDPSHLPSFSDVSLPGDSSQLHCSYT